MDGSIPFWMYILGFPLLLGPLVTLHELGHYLVGRWFGVHAEAFSVGFGKELAGFTDKRGTRWKLSALPLGGYVQFKGDMNPASIPDKAEVAAAPPEERAGNFHHASLGKRALIVAAGPVMNILIAVGIFAAFFMSYGAPGAADPAQSNTVAGFAEVSAAREAGLREGDRILSIDGEATPTFQDIQDKVLMYPDRRITLGIEREGEPMRLPVTIGNSVETDQFGNSSRVGRLGVLSSQLAFTPVGPVEAVGLAVRQSVGMVEMMVTGIAQIFTGERSVQELGGPVKIAKFSGEQLSMGPLAFINFAALISLNLAFINLLPIPALDGGHLAFYAAEAVRRKPLGARSTEIAYRAGVGLVLALMVFVTINDLVTLPGIGS